MRICSWNWVQQFGVDTGFESANQTAYDPVRDQVVSFGKYVGPGIHDFAAATFVYDGTSWTDVSPGTQPPARANGRMCWDAANQGVLLFGGSITTLPPFFDDTWLWDGTSWTNMSPATTPNYRTTQGLAPDPNNNVVMFGGFKGGPSPYLGDTWLWDGTDWTLQTPVTSPSARDRLMLTADPVNGSVVLYGGEDASSPAFSDTWLWNGSNWVQQFPASDPGPMSFAGGAFLVELGVVLAGGFTKSIPTFVQETWAWDGSDWEEIITATLQPSPFAGGNLAEFPSKSWIVQYSVSTNPSNPETWLLVPIPCRQAQVIRYR